MQNSMTYEMIFCSSRFTFCLLRFRVKKLVMLLKPGFHMIVTVGDASLRQARGDIGDSCVKWKHFLSDVSVTDQTGTIRGRIG